MCVYVCVRVYLGGLHEEVEFTLCTLVHDLGSLFAWLCSFLRSLALLLFLFPTFDYRDVVPGAESGREGDAGSRHLQRADASRRP